MQAHGPLKILIIRSKIQPPPFFVNLSLPLAAAPDLRGHEEVRGRSLGRSELRLLRLAAALPTEAATARRN